MRQETPFSRKQEKALRMMVTSQKDTETRLERGSFGQKLSIK